MFVFISLALIAGAVAQEAPSCGLKRDQIPFTGYIVGGRDEEPGSWPWQISLQYTNGQRWGHTCGGVLISEDWVLTAAHCVFGRDVPENFRIVAGAHNISSEDEDVQMLDIDLIIKHDGFKLNPLLGYPNDIALLRLASSVDLTGEHVGLACIADESLGDFSDNGDCWISGWGLTFWINRQIPDILQEARVNVPTNAKCRLSYPINLRATHICAGDGRPNACSGDSGGPMSCKVGDNWYVAGVTSFGLATCSLLPGVYTRISSYHDWIHTTMDTNARL